MNPTEDSSSPAHADDVAAIDAPMDRRPGVPAERRPEPVGGAHWRALARQVAQGVVLKDIERGELTATFGSGEAPRGLSGLMRRAAYGIPDYRARRWLLLILADRVDALEADVIDAMGQPLTWVVLGVAAAGATIPMLLNRTKPAPTFWQAITERRWRRQRRRTRQQPR